MTSAEQTAFIRQGFEALYRELEKHAPICLRSPGVPEEMRAGPADESGWYKWKLIPSRVTAADLDALEEQIGLPLPGLMRTFLSTCCHDFRDAELGQQLPDKPFDSILNAWNPALVRAGFLPFDWDYGGAYLRCVDLENMPDEDRCPLMEIDHEILFGLEEDAGRETLLAHMKPVADSFQAFLSEIFFGFFSKRSRELARRYLTGLREAYEDTDEAGQWEAFAAAVHGAGETDLAELKALYPELPAGLETLLRFADGTYYREYRPGEKTLLTFLGSDLEEFPYYLLSARQIIDTDGAFLRRCGSLIRREYDDVPVDEKIACEPGGLRWLHFADCRNNGGSSRLFLDFSPSEQGTPGQVVRWLHDPDQLAVIADSFDGYLELLMENEYDFLLDGE